MGNAGSGRERGQDAPLGSSTAGAAPGAAARAARRALLMQPLNYIKTKQSALTRGGQSSPAVVERRGREGYPARQSSGQEEPHLTSGLIKAGLPCGNNSGSTPAACGTAT